MTTRAPTRGTRARRRSKGEEGQALLELALVVPILVLLVMAIFQFAFVIQSQMGLTNAVREAARRAAANSEAAPTWSSGAGTLQGFVQQQLCGDLTPPCSTGLLEQNVPAFDASRLIADPPAVTFCTYPAAGATQYQVGVTVQYRHPLFFGLMAFATDAIDGTQDGAWTLASTAQMRLENVDSTTAGSPGATC